MRYILLLFLGACSLVSTAQMKDRVGELSDQLDSLLAHTDGLLEQKEKRIAHLKARITPNQSPEERFWLNKMLYEEFFAFSSDSALVYTGQNIKIAEQLKRKDWKDKWMINRSYLLTASGLLKEAEETLLQVDEAGLSSELKISYYKQTMYLYSHLGQYMGDQKEVNGLYYDVTKEANRFLLDLLHPEHPLYWWAQASYHEYNPTDSLIAGLEKVIGSSLLDSFEDALNAYVLSVLYKNRGNEDAQIKYLLCSAIADVRKCNRDVASLEELAQILYKKGDVDHAYQYIKYCAQAAQLYPNRVRMISVSSLLDQIHQYYQEQNIRQRKDLHMYLCLVSILSVVLILAVVLIYRQVKTLANSRKKLNQANELLNAHVAELSEAQIQLKKANIALQDLNQQLKSVNDRLSEENDIREEYIGYIFGICSGYISKLDEFRKNINRKMKVGQYDEVKVLTSNSLMAQNELKEFYQSFDSIFLRVYPDFVDDFNTLLRPDEKIILKEGERLNTELRIYALVRLGINDSVRIADFLHCSPQTVYNNRLRTRNKARIAKEEFVEYVQMLGKNKV